MPGDRLVAECIYDSSSRKAITLGKFRMHALSLMEVYMHATIKRAKCATGQFWVADEDEGGAFIRRCLQMCSLDSSNLTFIRFFFWLLPFMCIIFVIFLFAIIYRWPDNEGGELHSPNVILSAPEEVNNVSFTAQSTDSAALVGHRGTCHVSSSLTL